MTAIADQHLDQVATTLWGEVYERTFAGKARGRFVLSRRQLKRIIDTRRLDGRTVARLQDYALDKGLMIIDLDDHFAFAEVGVFDRWRRVPDAVLDACFAEESGEDEDEDDRSSETDADESDED
jgi:hypothetical protein